MYEIIFLREGRTKIESSLGIHSHEPNIEYKLLRTLGILNWIFQNWMINLWSLILCIVSVSTGQSPSWTNRWLSTITVPLMIWYKVSIADKVIATSRLRSISWCDGDWCSNPIEELHRVGSRDGVLKLIMEKTTHDRR